MAEWVLQSASLAARLSLSARAGLGATRLGAAGDSCCVCGTNVVLFLPCSDCQMRLLMLRAEHQCRLSAGCQYARQLSAVAAPPSSSADTILYCNKAVLQSAELLRARE